MFLRAVFVPQQVVQSSGNLMKFRNRVGRFLPEVAVANQCRQSQRARQTSGRYFTNAGYSTHILRSVDRLLIELTFLQIKLDGL